jgi:hypothetical protein
MVYNAKMIDLSTRLLLLNRRTRIQRPVESLNAYQEVYTSLSSLQDEAVMCPRSMKEPMREAMERVRAEVGDLDEFVARELEYPSVKEMQSYFMGLQVDSIALAIWQIRKQKALVCADQTGVGKGRVAAAVCRWTILHGLLPIFVTYSDTLFTDFQRDLDDIGFGPNVWPLLFNAGASITEQATGRKIFANKSSMKGVLTRIAETGELPRARNAVYLTYSQINTINIQQEALRRLAPKAVFILDESHNAGGDESNTGAFFQEVLPAAHGVMFLSATWAKRPDNMTLYATKTDISIAIPDNQRVSDAIRAGGPPLQTVVSHQLAQTGQLVRRERSFEGISILNFIDDRNQLYQEQICDDVTEVLRAIFKADQDYHQNDFETLRLQYKKRRIKIYHHKFSAIVHNIVKQFLLALKSDAAADCAIEALGRGEKPIVALESTMGAFLDSYVSAENLSEGEVLDKLSWSTILRRALDRTLHYTIKTSMGNDRQEFPRHLLYVETEAKYREAERLLDNLAVTLPVSPIDWIRTRITQAGFTVAEITGRSYRINYAGPVPVLSSVPSIERKDRVQTGSLFNNGGVDCLVLNQAGSTGISLHASEKFKDQHQRHMIVAQPAGDVNVFMQILGRSNRTGQMVLPRYTMLSLAIPAEIRPAISLAKKLKSLNANTSSNTRSAMSIEAPDMMNKYGDKIVAEWLHENEQIARLMGLTMDKSEEEGGTPEEDLARTATGRSALLPVKEQREFMETITESYTDYIAYLDETGQNDLEPKTYDFDAEQKTSHVIYVGSDPSSPFGEDAIFGTYSIKRQGKSYTPAEVEELIAQTYGPDLMKYEPWQRDTYHARALSAHLEGLFKPYIEGVEAPHIIERAQKIREWSRTILNDFRMGTGLRIEINGDTYNGIIYDIRGRKKVSGNPYAPSSLKFYIAVNGPLREVRVPGSQIKKITLSNLGRNADIADLFQDYLSDTRQRAKIIVGNLLGAYGQLKPGSKGRIITFTKHEGGTEQGILMPAKFDWEHDVTPQKLD